MGAGASISPGSHIRALTANKATPKSATIKIGKRVVRRKPKIANELDFHSALNLDHLAIVGQLIDLLILFS
tara:strand:+ start:782 stop:994 length:213 start_codon:yes stop_codon:yes gene_type:complete